MKHFFALWLGRTIADAGSQLTAFGLAVWFYQRSGSVVSYGFVATASVVPLGVIAPLAGVLVDRWDRRLVMIMAHAGSGVCAFVLTVLYALEMLELATVLPVVVISACFGAVQYPAFTASTTTMVSPEHLNRANALTQFGIALCQVASPAAAGFLLPTVGLGGILVINAATFFVAIALLLLCVRIPLPERTMVGTGASDSWLTQMIFGWRYIYRNSGLLLLLGILTVVNFNLGIFEVLMTPLVLGFADTQTLGTVLAVGGVGMLSGGAFIVVWGSLKRPVRGILAFSLLQGVFLCVIAARPSVTLAMIGSFGVLFTSPLIGGLSQIIWQRKVPADIQGRVFSFRVLIAGASFPLAFSLAGPLMEHVFEPLARRGELLSTRINEIVSIGAGRGAALLFLLLGCLTWVIVIVCRSSSRLISLEDETTK